MPTAAIWMGDGHVVHSCGDCEVDVPMGAKGIAHQLYWMNTEAFHFVLGTNFFVEHAQILSHTLQAPYILHVDHGGGQESVPLEQSDHTSSYLRACEKVPSAMMVASKSGDYQLLRGVLDQGLKESVYSQDRAERRAVRQRQAACPGTLLQQANNCCYNFYWPSFGMAYGNATFSELGKVLTKVALECFRIVLCSFDWGAHGRNEYSRTLLGKLTLTSIRMPDDAIYVSLGRKTYIGNPGWQSMLSVEDGGMGPVPSKDLDPAMVQEIQRESSGYTLNVLKDQPRSQDAVETNPGEEG